MQVGQKAIWEHGVYRTPAIIERYDYHEEFLRVLILLYPQENVPVIVLFPQEKRENLFSREEKAEIDTYFNPCFLLLAQFFAAILDEVCAEMRLTPEELQEIEISPIVPGYWEMIAGECVWNIEWIEADKRFYID